MVLSPWIKDRLVLGHTLKIPSVVLLQPAFHLASIAQALTVPLGSVSVSPTLPCIGYDRLVEAVCRLEAKQLKILFPVPVLI